MPRHKKNISLQEKAELRAARKEAKAAQQEQEQTAKHRNTFDDVFKHQPTPMNTPSPVQISPTKEEPPIVPTIDQAEEHAAEIGSQEAAQPLGERVASITSQTSLHEAEGHSTDSQKAASEFPSYDETRKVFMMLMDIGKWILKKDYPISEDNREIIRLRIKEGEDFLTRHHII